MQKQLDPNEVAARRSLAGSVMIWWIATTTSFWNIAKKNCPPDPDRPRDREVRRSEITGSSLQTKYALKGYNVEATALELPVAKWSQRVKIFWLPCRVTVHQYARNR